MLRPSKRMQRAFERRVALVAQCMAASAAKIRRRQAHYVRPALVEMPDQKGPMLEETFAPILYVMRYTDFADAIGFHNAVEAGLSSSIFTMDMREAERFFLRRLGLRDRQRQHRAFGRRDRRGIRRRERDRRWPRGRLRFLESLHAPCHQHSELWCRASACPGSHLSRRLVARHGEFDGFSLSRARRSLLER